MSNLDLAITFLFRQIPKIGKAEAVKACAWVFPGIKLERIEELADQLAI